jgi:hypothetical protein
MVTGAYPVMPFSVACCVRSRLAESANCRKPSFLAEEAARDLSDLQSGIPLALAFFVLPLRAGGAAKFQLCKRRYVYG